MTLSSDFSVYTGAVTGREHRRALRDGQDGFAPVVSPRVVGAVVTDGCGSGRTSEVGARLGAAWLARLVETEFAAVEDEALARNAAASAR